ncbi:transposase, partial [Actinomadura adrarensis]
MRGDLTDDEWALVEPHLPLGARGPIPGLRNQFNRGMWRFRTGSPWRDVPERYGRWSTIYDRFQIWAHDQIFQNLMEAMIAEAAARVRSTWTWSAWIPRLRVRITTLPGWWWLPTCWRSWRRPWRRKKGYTKGANRTRGRPVNATPDGDDGGGDDGGGDDGGGDDG